MPCKSPLITPFQQNILHGWPFGICSKQYADFSRFIGRNRFLPAGLDQFIEYVDKSLHRHGVKAAGMISGCIDAFLDTIMLARSWGSASRRSGSLWFRAMISLPAEPAQLIENTAGG
jgi:hypothetical protein